jgi:hypothetical protein
MSRIDLEGIVTLVLRRAHSQGSIGAREIREELELAGLSPVLWKDVLAQARPSLRYRQGRYHFVPPSATHLRKRARQEQSQSRAIRKAARQLIRLYRSVPVASERRVHARIQMVLPLQVQTERRRLLRMLSRDISVTGIRLLGNCPLLGQKVRVCIPFPTAGGESYCFLVHVLWSVPVGDGLVENGGAFLDLLTAPLDALGVVAYEQ